VTRQGKIPKVPCRKRGHKLNPLLSRPLIRHGRKLKSHARSADLVVGHHARRTSKLGWSR
jgi:hypothetical protein